MRRWLVLSAILLAITAGCGDSQPDKQDLLVSAAASLTDVFGAIEIAFEERHPAIDVVLNLAGSSALREQILAGAPADVFASADEANLGAVLDAELAQEAVVFAHNRMLIAVPKGNPAEIKGLEDFSNTELLLGLCADGVPCGDRAGAILQQAGISSSIDTYEPNVRALLTKIAVGELDGGIVYTTDTGAADIDALEIADAMNIVSDYSIAVLTETSNASAAEEFVAFVLSDAGRSILAKHGFDV